MKNKTPKRDVIVVGTSAGGLEALKGLVGQLPADLQAAVFIVWHVPADQPSLLPQILNRYSALPVAHANDGEAFEPGRIYVAPPDHHLVLEPDRLGHIRVTRGPRENRFRPSVDVLFRSAARAYGPRAIGVVLTGMLDDGASGLYAIKECGGLAVVQDPLEALFPEMPISAMRAVAVDHTVSISDLGPMLVRLVNETDAQLSTQPSAHDESPAGEAMRNRMDAEVRIALEDKALYLGAANLGEPSLYACPECHGVLSQIEEGSLLRFRCHTGHAYSLSTLLSGITGSVEDSLWNAVRTLEEAEMLMSHIARHLRESGHEEAAQIFDQKVQQVRQRGELVRQTVLSHEILTEPIMEASLPEE